VFVRGGDAQLLLLCAFRVAGDFVVDDGNRLGTAKIYMVEFSMSHDVRASIIIYEILRKDIRDLLLVCASLIK
jgi:hypothetical protein